MLLSTPPPRTCGVPIAPVFAIAASPEASAVKKEAFSFLLDFIKIHVPSVNANLYASLISPPETRSVPAIFTPLPKSDVNASSTDINCCNIVSFMR